MQNRFNAPQRESIVSIGPSTDAAFIFMVAFAIDEMGRFWQLKYGNPNHRPDPRMQYEMNIWCHTPFRYTYSQFHKTLVESAHIVLSKG